MRATGRQTRCCSTSDAREWMATKFTGGVTDSRPLSFSFGNKASLTVPGGKSRGLSGARVHAVDSLQSRSLICLTVIR